MTAVLPPAVLLRGVNLEKGLDQQEQARRTAALVRRNKQLARLKRDLCAIVCDALESYCDIVTELRPTLSDKKYRELWELFTGTCEREQLLNGRAEHLVDCATLLGLLEDLHDSIQRQPERYAGPEARKFLSWLEGTVFTSFVKPLVAQLRLLDVRNDYRRFRANRWVQ